MMKKIPKRMCVVTRERFPKQDLIRVVVNKEGIVTVDETGKQNGKGAYIKRDIDVLNKAISNKILDRTLGVTISDDIYNELRRVIGEQK